MTWMSLIPSADRKVSRIAAGVGALVERTIIAVPAAGLGPTAIDEIEIPASPRAIPT